jgi:hypothetical protein
MVAAWPSRWQRRCDAACVYMPTIRTTRRLLMEVMSLQKRPEVRNPRLWLNGVLAAGAAALAIRRGLHPGPPNGC